MKPSLRIILAAAVLAVCGNTASAIWPFTHKTKAPVSVETAAPSRPISQITIEITQSAVDQLGANTAFDVAALKAAVEAELTSAGVYKPDLKKDGDAMHISVFKVDFPSKFQALTMGIWSAKNPISGAVYVTGEHGHRVRNFDVKTDHPLGHLAYRKNPEQMQKLYDAFARTLVRDLTTAKG